MPNSSWFQVLLEIGALERDQRKEININNFNSSICTVDSKQKENKS